MAKKMVKGSWRWGWLLGAALATGSLAITGCDGDGPVFVTSLQPVYTQLDLEADSRLNGVWGDKEGDVTFSFEQGTREGKENEYEYKLRVKEKNGEQELSGEFEARLVRLGSTDFLDIYPQSDEKGSEFYRLHFARAHTFARLEIREDSIQLEFMSASWLKAKMDEKSVDTPCANVDGALLLTGTTEEVQELVSFHASDDEAFTDPVVLEKQKVVEEAQ
jgi:hypothetical protein